MARKTALVIGGNRFFGRHLTQALLRSGYEVTLLNRARQPDDLGDQVKRVRADRTRQDELEAALGTGQWDLVFDQICFTRREATMICRLLSGRTDRVLFTSSQSVYGYGLELSESAFDPFVHPIGKAVSAEEDYAEAKRQAESGFAGFPQLHPVMVRLPLVIGPDDYTGRFSWHVERCAKQLPIFFPNEEARLGFIRSDIAGRALLEIAESPLTGPVNCASPGSTGLQELMRLIEERTGKRYVRAPGPGQESHSPYGVEQDWTMSTRKLEAAGIALPALSSWLPSFVADREIA